METVFADNMSSCVALVWHLETNTVLWTKYFQVIEENANLKCNRTLQQETNKIGFKCHSYVNVQFRIISYQIKILINKMLYAIIS